MTNFKNKLIRFSLAALLAIYPLASASSLVMATEATSSAGSGTNWSDPNNWYQEWLAKRAAMDAQLAAAANSNTGADSTNNSTNTTNNSTDANLVNDGQIVNVASGEANTGDSSSNRNTGDGSITSGTAVLSAQLSTDANQVALGNLEIGSCSLSICGANSDGAASNDKTGSGSTNNATNTNDNSNDFTIANDLDILNKADFKANSGYNHASRNTGDGTIVSGDADLTFTAINVGNNVNVGAQVFNVMDDQTGDLVLNFDNLQTLQTAGGAGSGSANNQTGADSTNNATTTSNNNNTIVINNDGSIANDYLLNAVTGNNDASRNTGNSSITTGDANVALNVINFLNNTFLGGTGDLLLGIVNIFGTLNGNIVVNPPVGGAVPVTSPESLNAANATTGAGSANNSTTTNNNTLGIGVQNTADVLNGISLNANTGSNDASLNTGSSNVQTGNVNAQLKTTNIANTTTIGGDGTLWLVLVNNMGNWTGQLMGLNADGVASPFFTFAVGPDGSLMAVNNQTGADSTNNAATTNNNNSNINVTNNGTVNNNIVINADTGHNDASRNTGDASVKTGNVNLAANVMNILNNTFIGSRMVVTIVNVFGNFFGNVQTPGSGGIGSASTPALANSTLASSPTNGSTNHGSSSPNHGSSSGGSGSSTGNNVSQSTAQQKSLILAANDFGTPKITKVVNQAGGRLNLSNLLFTLIITAASVQLLLKLGRRGWLTRKA